MHMFELSQKCLQVRDRRKLFFFSIFEKKKISTGSQCVKTSIFFDFLNVFKIEEKNDIFTS